MFVQDLEAKKKKKDEMDSDDSDSDSDDEIKTKNSKDLKKVLKQRRTLSLQSKAKTI